MAHRIILALLLSTAAAFAPAVKPRAATQLRAGGDGEITAVRACETVHESNCRGASPATAIIMASTPSMRRQHDGVAVWSLPD